MAAREGLLEVGVKYRNRVPNTKKNRLMKSKKFLSLAPKHLIEQGIFSNFVSIG